MLTNFFYKFCTGLNVNKDVCNSVKNHIFTSNVCIHYLVKLQLTCYLHHKVALKY